MVFVCSEAIAGTYKHGPWEITSQCYLAENNKYMTGNYTLAPVAHVIYPIITGSPVGVTTVCIVGEDSKVAFYPAICLDKMSASR